MHRFFFRIGLLVCLWYEIAVELNLASNTAFLVALLVVGGGWAVLRMPGQLMHLLGPRTAALLVHSAAWMVLLWALAPPVLLAQPFVLDVFALFVLAMVGARCRALFERERLKHGRDLLRMHSGWVVGVILAALFGTMLALRTSQSLWPLVGYLMLPGLPFSFGWRMVTAASPERPDAKVGSAGAFRDAGLSEER